MKKYIVIIAAAFLGACQPSTGSNSGNADGSIAVVVMNPTAQRLPFHLWIKGKAAETASLPHSIMTLVL